MLSREFYAVVVIAQDGETVEWDYARRADITRFKVDASLVDQCECAAEGIRVQGAEKS